MGRTTEPLNVPGDPTDPQTDPNVLGVVNLEVVVQFPKSKGEYLFRFWGVHGTRVSVYKRKADLSWAEEPAYFLARLGDHCSCSCPWMSHNPTDYCKHAYLCEAVWAHWLPLTVLYQQYHRAALSFTGLTGWRPGMPPIPITTA